MEKDFSKIWRLESLSPQHSQNLIFFFLLFFFSKNLMIPILGMGLKREEPRQIVAVGATMPTKGFCLEIFFFFNSSQ